MARLPDAEIARLKQEIAVERLAEAAGITLKPHGADLIGLCPFHDDHEPSLVITPAKNLWHCLGACQAGGSVIDWVMKMEGVSFRHAVELLLTDYQPVAASRTSVKRSTVTKLPAPFRLDTDDQALLNQVIDYYHGELPQHPETLAYLAKRGIAHPEAIDHFKLGYANRTLGYRLPEKNRKDGAALRGALQRLGLLRASGHEHFNGSLVIPILDEQGNVTEVYGRKIGERLRAGTPLHLYLPGPHQGVFNLDALQTNNEIILCESLIDALTFWCAGYRNVTASYGVEGFTPDHLTAFKAHKIERVLIAYDRDAAGDAAAAKLAKTLVTEGIDAYRIVFPKGMDANDYALSIQPTSKSLGLVIRKAEWLGTGIAKPRPDSDIMPADADAPPIDLATDTHFQQQLSEIAEQLDSFDAPLPATPVPAVNPSEIDAEVQHDDIVIVLGGDPRHPDSGSHKAIPGQNRRYRVRGLHNNLSHAQLKINLLVTRDDALHIDTFDLYAARHRATFTKQAAVELGLNEDIIKKDLGKILLKLEAMQEATLNKTLTPAPTTAAMNETERAKALTLLHDPQLIDRILDDFSRCGVVGEETNKLVGYLAAVSRKLDEPLAIVIQSTSAAGKTALMDAVLALVPAEDRLQYSAMTGQSLFYLGERNLKHKILAIAEEEGAHQAAYALKLLQSEGQLTIASTGKDPDSGKHVTHEYTVEGPVMLFLTTTAIDIDEELMNRCLVLTVDEQRSQTQAIHALQRQRRTLEGLLAKKEKEKRLTLHRNAQRLLHPLAVVNPYAERLTFLDDRTRTRRDHEKYLTLIDTIALLHQYQRPQRSLNHDGKLVEYIEVTLEDIDTANRLAHDVLGRSLDELAPQTRRLLQLLEAMVSAQCQAQAIPRSDYHFSRKAVREATGWGDTQLKIHLQRLTDMEYLLLHKHGNQYRYELLYDGQGDDGTPHLNGLIDITTLKEYDYDAQRSGDKMARSGAGRPAVGGVSGAGWANKKSLSALPNSTDATIDNDANENTVKGNKKVTASCRSHTSLVAKG